MSPVLMPAKVEKTNIYIMVVKMGLKKNHNGPKIVCLYTVTKSRLTYCLNRSR